MPLFCEILKAGMCCAVFTQQRRPGHAGSGAASYDENCSKNSFKILLISLLYIICSYPRAQEFSLNIFIDRKSLFQLWFNNVWKMQ